MTELTREQETVVMVTTAQKIEMVLNNPDNPIIEWIILLYRKGEAGEKDGGVLSNNANPFEFVKQMERSLAFMKNKLAAQASQHQPPH